MNDHNLDDLIIDNIAPKNGKTKSILTIIALLIVVLIIAIILTKILLKDPNSEQMAIENDATEMISPELTLQNATQKKEPKKELKEETKLSTIIETEPKAPTETIKKEEIKKEVVVKTEVTPEEKTVTPIKETVKITKEFSQEATKETSAQEKPLPATIIDNAKKQPTGKPVNIPSEKAVSLSGYYIQVGSFTQTPSSHFLSIIKNSGFTYTITPAIADGTKKLLIGPYQERKTADTALVRVKDRINKSAFIIKK